MVIGLHLINIEKENEMSTKKTYRTKDQLLQARAEQREIQHKSVVAEFQAVVEELQARGMTDVDVHSIVNMIFQGWMVAGQPTQEYMELAVKAQEQRALAEQGIEIVDSAGIQIGK
jgi:hypothetical protein